MTKKLNGVIPPKSVLCKQCGKRKKLEDMAQRSSLKWGIRPFCRLCWNSYIRSYKKSPKGKIATALTNKRYWDKQSKELENADVNQ